MSAWFLDSELSTCLKLYEPAIFENLPFNCSVIPYCIVGNFDGFDA